MGTGALANVLHRPGHHQPKPAPPTVTPHPPARPHAAARAGTPVTGFWSAVRSACGYRTAPTAAHLEPYIERAALRLDEQMREAFLKLGPPPGYGRDRA